MQASCSRLSIRALLCVVAAFTIPPASAIYADPAVQPTPTPASTATAPTEQSADLTVGGLFVFRLHGSMGGMTAQDRVDEMLLRLTNILGTANIKPSDVVLYAPQNAPPTIFVMGRRFATVDATTARMSGIGSARALAKLWASSLQQVLPRVDWRPSNAADTVVPARCPLTVTDNLANVGGSVGDVVINGKLVIRFRGVQPGAITAAERADNVQSRLQAAIYANKQLNEPVALDTRPGALAKKPTDDQTLTVGGTPVVTVDVSAAKLAGLSTPSDLAKSWIKNITAALAPLPTPVVATGTSPASAPTASSPQATAATTSPVPPIAPVAPAVATTPSSAPTTIAPTPLSANAPAGALAATQAVPVTPQTPLVTATPQSTEQPMNAAPSKSPASLSAPSAPVENPPPSVASVPTPTEPNAAPPPPSTPTNTPAH